MNYIRPITAADLPAILALSERTGSGLTSLPANEKRLADRIERSLASFAGKAERADACYMFVLVDGATDKLVGISAIEAAVGLR
jgi:arginine N-succinyltransferase